MEIYKNLKKVNAINIPGLSNMGVTMRDFLVRTSFIGFFITLLIALAPDNAFAQSGWVIGKVSDVQTGEPLNGAGVNLEGTGFRADTDENGRFVIRGVPAGEYSLVVAANGYSRQEVPVSVNSGEHAVQYVGLYDDLPEGDAQFIVAKNREVARALSNQQNSAAITSVITREQIDRFADYSVQDALARIPGVQTNHHGEVNIRGAGYNNYNVTMDGRRTATTGMGNRNFDLSSLSADMVNNVEVIKVVTPDMNADALAGTVNLVTRRPAGGDMKLRGRFGGGAMPRYFRYTGPESRAMLQYDQALHEDVFLSVDLSQQSEIRGQESLGLDFNHMDFGSGNEDVFERIIPGLHTSERNRLGGRIKVTYQPSVYTSYYLQGFAGSDAHLTNRHRNVWDTGGDWIRPDTTGAESGEGSHLYDALLQDTKTNFYSLNAGGSHIFNAFDVSYDASWSQGRSNRVQYNFPFLVEGLDYSLDLEEPNKPLVHITNIQLFDDGTMDRRRYNFQPVDRVRNDHIDNTFSGNLDVNIPFRIGSFKLGSSADLTFKDGEFGDANFSYGRVTLHRFNVIRRGDFDPFNHYHMAHLVNTEFAREFFQSSRPGFVKDVDLERERSDIWNYNANEQIYSGYGMATVNAGMFTLLAGARLEQTVSSNEGNQVRMSEDGDHISTSPVIFDNSYSHLLPNAQLLITPGSRSNIRLAWTQTIARPDFNLQAPFELVNARDSLRFRGNPELEPVTSDNLDLQLEYYLPNAGAVTMGLFHKQLEGFVVQTQRTVTDSGEFEGWLDRTYENSDESATIYGFEVSWQQNLLFLPGFLSRLSTYANYTWSESVYEVDYRDDDVALPGQSPHVVNAALQYSQGRISGQVNYHWTAPSLQQVAEVPVILPSIDASQPVYADRYQDGWSDVSVSMRIRISENFRFWADIYNLLNVERIQYDHTRDLYPRETYLSNSRGFRAGVRMDL